MKVNVEELSSVQRRLTAELPADMVGKTLDKLYDKVRRTAKLKGFRPGKAPRKVLERYYGLQVAYEAAEKLLQDNYPEAMKQAEVEPLAQPEFDFDPPEAGKDFVFKVVFDVRPEFDLDPATYKGFEIKEPALEVTDEEMASRLEALRERQAMLVPVEEQRPSQIGDVVVVDYQSFDGDDPMEGGEAENVDIELGKGQAHDELEVALLKTKPGDIVEATVHYDDQTPNEALRGKDVRFKMVVKELKNKLLPELDDDFARSVSPEFDTLDSLKDRIKADLEKAYEGERLNQVRRQILDHIRDLGEFELPESLVDQELHDMVEGFKSRLRQSGMDPEQAGLDEQKLADDFRPEAEKKVRAGIVLGKISEVEDVNIEEEDLQAKYEEIAGQTGQPATAIKEIYIKNNMIPSLTAQLLEEKTLQALKAGAIIKSVDPAELAAEIQQKQAEQEA